MTVIHAGRFTAAHDGPLTVFLIGMRVNRWSAVKRWWTTLTAMAPMLRALARGEVEGYLGGFTFFTWRGAGCVQYWRSFEELERFAVAPEAPHLGAWRRFNRMIGKDGSVGIWHETYQVAPGRWETVYNNMPVFGLAAAAGHVPIDRASETARQRIGGTPTASPARAAGRTRG